RDGLGLGLSIVAAIAEAHGAWIRAHALPGGGLGVRVGFPLAPAARPAPSVPHSPSVPPSLSVPPPSSAPPAAPLPVSPPPAPARRGTARSGASGPGSGRQGGGDLRGVFGAADEAHLAVAELPVMVHVHRDVLAGRGDGEGVADEHHDIAISVAGEGQRGKLG